MAHPHHPQTQGRCVIIANVQIAVVDHEPAMRDYIAHVMMYSVNRNVQVFESAHAILQAMQNGRTIHIVLSETRMPSGSGLDLLRQIRKDHPGIFFVAISADPADEAAAMETGADAFLAKPFFLKDLFGIVQRFVVESSNLYLNQASA